MRVGGKGGESGMREGVGRREGGKEEVESGRREGEWEDERSRKGWRMRGGEGESGKEGGKGEREGGKKDER